MSTIRFFYTQQTSFLRQRKKLKAFLITQASSYGRPIKSLSVIFCSDEYLLNMNKDFLQHDYYTDIITFDLAEKKTDPIEAELYISIERVTDNAIQLGVTNKQELLRVVFHGLLHLLGFKDKTLKDKQ